MSYSTQKIQWCFPDANKLLNVTQKASKWSACPYMAITTENPKRRTCRLGIRSLHPYTTYTIRKEKERSLPGNTNIKTFSIIKFDL